MRLARPPASATRRSRPSGTPRWLIEQRRTAPDEGPGAERRAQLEAAIASERRLAERAARERDERERRIAAERERLARDEALQPAAERLAAALQEAGSAVAARLEGFEAELRADREAGERLTGELRACAAQESQVQGRLKERGEEVTRGEVRAQQARDRAADAGRDLGATGREARPRGAARRGAARRGRARRPRGADRAPARAGASSSARSTRSPSASTRRRSRTSRSSRASARTWKPRCASSRA